MAVEHGAEQGRRLKKGLGSGVAIGLAGALGLIVFTVGALALGAGEADGVAGQGTAPEMATDDQDVSLLVWVGADGDGDGIKARLVDKHANPLGSEFVVNDVTSGTQRAPDVVFLSNGEYLVVWETDDLGDFDVAARRFDRAGLAIGLDFRINVATGTQKDPAIAQDGEGQYAVVWTTESGGGFEHVGQVFDDASDVPIGDGVTFGNTAKDVPPEIGSNDEGVFLATWEDDEENIKGQRFDNAGLAIGLELQISDGAGADRAATAVAKLDDGEYYVVWQEGDGEGSSIFGRKVDSAGLAIGLALQINSSEEGDQANPSIGRLGNSPNLVVVWQGDDGKGGPSRIVRRFVKSSTGRPFGSEKTISSMHPADQHSPAVSPAFTGPLVVVWQGDSDQPGGTPVIRLQDDQEILFGDGFESADTGEWTTEIP